MGPRRKTVWRKGAFGIYAHASTLLRHSTQPNPTTETKILRPIHDPTRWSTRPAELKLKVKLKLKCGTEIALACCIRTGAVIGLNQLRAVDVFDAEI